MPAPDPVRAPADHDGAVPVVRTATPADGLAVRTVLARSLADDPLMRWVLGDVEDRASHVAMWLLPFVDRYVALGRGRVVDGAEPGTVAAAALWRWPDDDLSAGPLGASLPTLTAVRPALVGAARSTEFGDAMAAVRAAAPELRGAYLHLLGVDPARHRQGLGRALVEDGVRRARADGLGVVLATCSAANVAFYRSCGLEVLAEGALPGGPSMWTVGTRDAVVG